MAPRSCLVDIKRAARHGSGISAPIARNRSQSRRCDYACEFFSFGSAPWVALGHCLLLVKRWEQDRERCSNAALAVRPYMAKRGSELSLANACLQSSSH
mmetsp:Transcript_20975/g.52996  ORF Transcript_20975/g.52996 Transcript_20975/m.52996 type:complete len:99 (+) Transcript_20975:75-371(+)